MNKLLKMKIGERKFNVIVVTVGILLIIGISVLTVWIESLFGL